MHQGFVDLVHLVFRVHLRNRAGPGAGLSGFGVIAFASPEFQVIELDHARFGSKPLGLLQGMHQQVVGAGKTRIGAVHRGGGNAGEARRAGLALDFAFQGMRRMRLGVALGRMGEIDQHAAVFGLHRKGGNTVFLEAGLAKAGAAVEFPSVPGAGDIAAVVEMAVAERAARVIAYVGDDAELSIPERDGERDILDLKPLQRPSGKSLCGAYIYPGFFTRP